MECRRESSSALSVAIDSFAFSAAVGAACFACLRSASSSKIGL